MTAPDTLRPPRSIEQGTLMTHTTVPMDTFKWIVTGLLSVLLVSIGWFLSDIRADLRDVRKEVTAIRVEAAAANTRLESLMEEARRRSSR
jgi:hypothetical protein